MTGSPIFSVPKKKFANQKNTTKPNYHNYVDKEK